MQDAEPDGGAAAEPSTARNSFDRRTLKGKTRLFRPLKKQIGCLRDDFLLSLLRLRAADHDRIINAQRNAKAVEARTKIGSAGWNADGDLFHDERVPDIIQGRNRMTKE